MAPLIVLVLAAVLTVPLMLILCLIWGVLPRHRKPQRMVECAVCGRTIPVNKAVIVHGHITRQHDAYATTIAEYCKTHAPGPPRSLP